MNDPKVWLQTAETKLDHARQIFDIGLYDDAISRAYYAMFYAAKDEKVIVRPAVRLSRTVDKSPRIC
jgi:hypothetical protein